MTHPYLHLCLQATIHLKQAASIGVFLSLKEGGIQRRRVNPGLKQWVALGHCNKTLRPIIDRTYELLKFHR